MTGGILLEQDWLSIIYGVSFLFGLVLSVISLVMGAGHDAGGDMTGHGDLHGIGHIAAHHGGDFSSAHLGHGDASGAHMDAGHNSLHSSISPLNFSTLMAFLTWFGCVGYILHHYKKLSPLISLPAGIIGGLIGGGAIYLFIAKVLIAGERIMNPADYKLEGRVATVSTTIMEGKTGEITLKLAGERKTFWARCSKQGQIEKGTEVVVERYEKGFAYVYPAAEFLSNNQYKLNENEDLPIKQEN